MRLVFLASVFSIVLPLAANATTCSQAVARCAVAGKTKPNIESQCKAAGNACKATGVFYGPVSGTTWSGLRKE